MKLSLSCPPRLACMSHSGSCELHVFVLLSSSAVVLFQFDDHGGRCTNLLCQTFIIRFQDQALRVGHVPGCRSNLPPVFGMSQSDQKGSSGSGNSGAWYTTFPSSSATVR